MGIGNSVGVYHCINYQLILYDLSKVQLKEGKRQMSLSEKTMDTIELFTQVEIIFLIVMAVLIQLIVLYQPKDKKQSQAQE
jgi:hypothetical protein